MQRQKLATSQAAAPFLKWAGGKGQLLQELGAHVPAFERYFEPFLGGGAFFFYLASRHSFTAHLSDANSDLVNAYSAVKSDVDELVELLARHELAYKKDPYSFYYRLRSSRPQGIRAAARFIALNKTCYNGLYRVNRSGEFNVPIGSYKNPAICDAERLKSASAALNHCRARISCASYGEALKKARAGDFVYLDPPFVPLSKTAHFVDYTQDGFGEQDQADLAKVFSDLDRRGCKVLLSNSDTKTTRDLYSGFTQRRVPVSRAISCKGAERTGYAELLVCNY
jgi:DNA adenine methylase